MTSYIITVNGRSYDVTVQKKQGAAMKHSQAAVPEMADASPAPVMQSNVLLGEGERVLAPMPGKIIEIHVRAGQCVQKGQTLLIMEAMKMHNPVLAANEGVIRELCVTLNDPVQSGQLLLVIGK